MRVIHGEQASKGLQFILGSFLVSLMLSLGGATLRGLGESSLVSRAWPLLGLVLTGLLVVGMVQVARSVDAPQVVWVVVVLVLAQVAVQTVVRASFGSGMPGGFWGAVSTVQALLSLLQHVAVLFVLVSLAPRAQRWSLPVAAVALLLRLGSNALLWGISFGLFQVSSLDSLGYRAGLAALSSADTLLMVALVMAARLELARAPSSEPAPVLRGGGGGLLDLSVGALATIVGLVITAWSYVAAGPGGRFVVAFGLVLFGLFRLGRGFVRLLRR